MSKILFPGSDICNNEGFIRGHGTSLKDGRVKSAYYGTLKQINKLLTVDPVYSYKYVPEIGDVIIGRVTEIYNKKWKIDANSKCEVSLNLSAINLPGVVQRRKLESDEMDMRKIFAIDDLIVCEVQKVSKGGNGALHTRSDKYGKLAGGFLIKIPMMYIATPKTRFVIRNNTSMIVAANGHIWISNTVDSTIVPRINAEVTRLIRSKLKVNIEEIVDKLYLEG